MTLKDIAKEAGVSVSTVSRVINNTDSKVARPQVRERIWEIVRRTGYTPNYSAQNLKLGRDSGSTARHSLTCLFARTPNAPQNPFFSTIARSVEAEAYKQNYFLKSSFSIFDIKNPETYYELQDNTNGVVILGRCDSATLKFLCQSCRYLIYAGLNPLDIKCDQVLCDGYQATYAAMNYLHELGHRHIGFVGETANENRFLGYRAFQKEHALPFERNYVSTVPLTSADAYEGTLRLLERRLDLTALFCGDDIAAIGVLRAIRDFGLRVPDDLSVISIDDIETAQFLSPMLTTVHVPMEEMGNLAAKLLIDRINGGHSLPLQIKLPFYLAKRESCARLEPRR